MALSRSDYWKQKFLGLLKRIGLRIGIVVSLFASELLILFCCIAPAALLEKVDRSAAASDVAGIVVFFAYVSLHLLLIILLVRPPKKWRDRWVKKDAERWLREKHATGYRPRPIVQKLIRQAIWIPTVLTLLILLFLPEIFGVWSQRYLSRPVTISGHPIHVPRTWIYWGQSQTGDDHEFVSLIILKGAGTGKIRDWWYGNPPIANIRVESQRAMSNVNPEYFRFVRTIKHEGLELQCWQIPLHYQAVMLRCSSQNGEMTAEFYGSGIYLKDFYAAIEK